jgi:hypothetical protein
MEDLISFEDLVVQPYNSYFNLEKELHEVKAKLTLVEKRLKYLEDKIGYGCKGQLTLEEKINALDIKYEELDDTILIVEDGLQKDIKGIIKRLEEDKCKKIEEHTKTIRTIYLGFEISIDNAHFCRGFGYKEKKLQEYLSNYNIIKELSINMNYLDTKDIKDLTKYFLKHNNFQIEKLKIMMKKHKDDLTYFIDTVIELKFKCKNILR